MNSSAICSARVGSLVTAFVLSTGMLFSSCALMPKFQEGSKDGYTVENGATDSLFNVNLHLDGVQVNDFKAVYAMRAVGETCAKRGYQHFSYGKISADQVRGYCYKTPTIRALGVTFVQNVATGEKIVVESLNGKAPSSLKVNDEILAVNGKKISAIYQIKDQVVEATRNGKSTLSMKIVSASKELNIEEPFTSMSDGVFGPQDLEKFRADVK